LQPHAAQVISIFRILGIGYDDESKILGFGADKLKEYIGRSKLYHNLVQIKTGEGKSITLAITAIIFALFGYDIDCACYSDYLSRRDYQAFEPIFSTLGLVDYIHYGTFNQLCERYINN
jgi:hypothetical protein